MTFKKFCMILSAFIAVFLISTVETYAADADVIENNEAGIPNKVLYEKILNELGKKPGETFTEGEAKTIDSLYYNRKGGSLKGIGRLSELEELDLESSEVESLAGIEELKKLKRLNLRDNKQLKMKDLTFFAEFHSLESLDVSENQLSNLHGVEGLVNLKYIGTSWNRLKGLNELKGLTNLEFLSVAGNRLGSLHGIQKLKKLETLYADYNELRNIKEVKGLTNLTTLKAAYNYLTDINPIKNLKKLHELTVNGNRIKKLPNMKGFSKLLYVFTEFTDNLLTEDEMTKKLPAKLLKHKDWLSRQMTVQNRNDRIRITAPKNKRITSKTKKIEGYVQQNGVYVALVNLERDLYESYNPIKIVKIDQNGHFVMKNLKLKHYKGNTLGFFMINKKPSYYLRTNMRLIVK